MDEKQQRDFLDGFQKGELDHGYRHAWQSLVMMWDSGIISNAVFEVLHARLVE
jgi:hypothetical protein